MDPFHILDIDITAHKSEIIQAVGKALRERKFSAKDIAEAQRLLLDPLQKSIYAYLERCNLKPFYEQCELIPPKIQKERTLKRLSLFDDEAYECRKRDTQK